MGREPDTEVMVIGAGSAGLATAVELSRVGDRVRVVEAITASAAARRIVARPGL